MPLPAISYPPELPVSAARDEIAAAIHDHQVVIVAGETVPNDATLTGKNIYTGDVAAAVREPEAFVQRALAEAKPYVAPAAVAAVSAPAAATAGSAPRPGPWSSGTSTPPS